MSPLVPLLPLLLACHGGGPAPESLLEASRKVGFQTLVGLGPHRMEADVLRRVTYPGEEPQESDTHMLFVWQDWDDFRLQRVQDGEVLMDILVVGGKAWMRGPRGRMRRKEDAEPFRAQLQEYWNAWEDALDPFLGRIALEEAERGVVEGRRARRFTVGLAPEPEGGSPGTVVPLSLEGELWLDEATAVRLQADVQGSWQAGPDDPALRELSFHLQRGSFGDPGKLEPPRRKGRRKARGKGRARREGGTEGVAAPAGAE